MPIQSYIIYARFTEFSYGLKVFLNYSVFEKKIWNRNITLALSILIKNPHQKKKNPLKRPNYESVGQCIRSV